MADIKDEEPDPMALIGRLAVGAAHDIGQVAGFAEQIVDPDRGALGCGSHVRIVQDKGKSLHRFARLNLQKNADGRTQK